MLATAHTNRGLAESRRGGWELGDPGLTTRRSGSNPSSSTPTTTSPGCWPLAPWTRSATAREAVEHATWACKATGWSNPSCVGTFAAASAEIGDFAQAVKWQKYALGDSAYRKAYGEQQVIDRMHLYEQGLPFRLPMGGG